MGIGNSLQTTVKEWGVLAMFVVIISVVLYKFRDVDGVTSDLNTTINTIVTAFSEPRNWIGIVIIAAIGIALLGYFKSKKM